MHFSKNLVVCYGENNLRDRSRSREVEGEEGSLNDGVHVPECLVGRPGVG